MRIYWAFIALFLHHGLGAYVQWKQCDDFTGTSVWTSSAALSLAATLRPNGSATQMSLELSDSPKLPECNTGPNIKDAIIDITLLGGSKTFSSPILDGPCAIGSAGQANQSSDPWPTVISLSQNLDNIYPLSTFLIAIHLLAINTTEVACISAYITPEIPRSIRDALCYGPLAVLITVLATTYCRVLLSSQEMVVEGDEGPSHKSSPVINGIGDCLSHLQFTFLSACLSLVYPGFFQPAVSALNWFSLFSSSNAFLKGYTYSGTNDGIYEVNGTYGGTFGMEHMIQNIGAPMTMEIWINMVILTLLALAAAAVLIVLHRLLCRQLYPSNTDQPFSTMGQLIKDVLRMVLSYFMQPIVAVSAYQLDHIGLLPSYLISMAVLLIAIILAAYVWLFRHTTSERLAALMIDVTKATQGTKGSKPRRPNLRAFLLIHFALVFLRGIVIGAVQVSGQAQVAMLLFCEFALVASVIKFVPNLLRSTLVYNAVGRFIALSLMIAWLVPSTTVSAKSLVAYLVLALELVMLVVLILIPQLYAFWKFWLRRAASKKAPVYSMRQLQRRPPPVRQLPARPRSSEDELICVNCGLDPTVRSDTISRLHLDITNIRSPTNSYTRPSTRATRHGSRSPSGASREFSSPSGASSPMLRKEDICDVVEEPTSYPEPISRARSHGDRITSGGSYASLASNPPDVDYAVREMDLYYREPRQAVFGEEASPQRSRKVINLEPLSRWWKETWHPTY